MPSKKYNGNSPLGGSKIDGFADAELQIARRTPLQALSTGVVQTPNGAIHVPKRRRRSNTRQTELRPWECRASTIIVSTIEKNRLVINKGKFGDYTEMPPTGILSTSSAGSLAFLFEKDGSDTYYAVCLVANYESPQPGDPEEWVWSSEPIFLSHTIEAGDTTSEYDEEDRPIYPIAAIRVRDNGITIRQLVYTNLGLVNGCFNGDYIKMLAPV